MPIILSSVEVMFWYCFKTGVGFLRCCDFLSCGAGAKGVEILAIFRGGNKLVSFESILCVLFVRGMCWRGRL